jgi:hypothetical protein
MYGSRFIEASSIRMKTMLGFFLAMAEAVAVAVAVALGDAGRVVVADRAGMAVDTAAGWGSGPAGPIPNNVRDASTRNTASRYLGRRLSPSAMLRTPPK